MASAVHLEAAQLDSPSPAAKRIFELSLPKQSKRIWLTDFWPRTYWGNQDTIKPLKSSVLEFEANERLKVLAQPKPNHSLQQQQSFDKKKRKSSSSRAESAESRNHIERLATPKQSSRLHTPNRELDNGGREGQIWPISYGALQCESRPRTVQLARSRSYHRDYLENKNPQSVVSEPARACEASERIRVLSKPRTRLAERVFKDSGPEHPIRIVTPGARKASASPRTVELARSKVHKEGYVGNRAVAWLVTTAARRATASSRTSELATPATRLKNDEMDPDAFLINPVVLKAQCSARLAELAMPINR